MPHNIQSSSTFITYDHLPSQLERYLIEIIPDLIAITYDIRIDGVALSPRKAYQLNKSVRDALCFARRNGTAYLYLNKNGQVTINSAILTTGDANKLYPDVVVAHNEEYQSYFSQLNYVQPGDNIDLFLKEWKTGSPLITEDVCTAYSLFRNAQDRAYLRLKNGNGSLLSLTDGEDEADQLNAEVIKLIDKKYDVQNRMYAPDGAKLTGISVSLDGIQQVLDAFWENIFRAAVIPPWAYEKQQLNSSFTIEHMVKEKERLWYKEVYPVMLEILTYYCPGCVIDIKIPNYYPAKYTAEVAVLEADARNRDAVSANNLAQAESVKEQTKQAKTLRVQSEAQKNLNQ